MTPGAEQRFGILPFLCNHFVSVAWTLVAVDDNGRQAGEESFLAWSAFVISLRGKWWLATAGHCVTTLRDSRVGVTRCCLADFFGSAPRRMDCIDFPPGAKVYLASDTPSGLDFALIAIPASIQAALADNGIRPLGEDNWHIQPPRFDGFAMLGLPACMADKPFDLFPYGAGVAGTVSPTLVHVSAHELHPDEMNEEMAAAPFRPFLGKVGAKEALPDIGGMSGGPIYGFAQDSEGAWRYWLVAVVTAFWDEDRVLVGCPVNVFVEKAEQALAEEAMPLWPFP